GLHSPNRCRKDNQRQDLGPPASAPIKHLHLFCSHAVFGIVRLHPGVSVSPIATLQDPVFPDRLRAGERNPAPVFTDAFCEVIARTAAVSTSSSLSYVPSSTVSSA